MKKQSFKNVSRAAVIGLAAAVGIVPSSSLANNIPALHQEIKAIKESRQHAQKQAADVIGGTRVIAGGTPGLTPKQYGILYGHGNTKGKTNFLRLAHNAKLKRR